MCHFRRKTSKGHGGGDTEKRSRWLKRLELEYTRGKTRVRQRPSGVCHFISARQPAPPHSCDRHYHGNPCDRTRGSLHQVNKAALNDMQEEKGEKQMRRTKGASRARERVIRCVREEGGTQRRMGRKIGNGKQEEDDGDSAHAC